MFSIIIPVYNIAPYLSFCLDSVLEQTFSDYECILIDDGSTDNSSSICDDYSLKDNRIKVIHKENSGPSDARNAGISFSTGLYTVFIDGDDVLSNNNALHNLSNVIRATDAPVIFNGNFFTFKDNKDIYNSVELFHGNCEYYSPNEYYKTLMYTDNALFATWLFTVNREFLNKNNLFFKSGILHEDELWIPFVICFANKIAINNNPFYSYRKDRDQSTMSTNNPKKLSDLQIIINDIQERKAQIQKEMQFILDDRCIILWHTVFDNVFYFNKQYADVKKKIIKELKNQKKVLLNGNKIKNYIYFFLLAFFGLKNTFYLRKTARKLLKSVNK
jgi:glycosyltransferase involved in cell wall biosynthesis